MNLQNELQSIQDAQYQNKRLLENLERDAQAAAYERQAPARALEAVGSGITHFLVLGVICIAALFNCHPNSASSSTEAAKPSPTPVVRNAPRALPRFNRYTLDLAEGKGSHSGQAEYRRNLNNTVYLTLLADDGTIWQQGTDSLWYRVTANDLR